MDYATGQGKGLSSTTASDQMRVSGCAPQLDGTAVWTPCSGRAAGRASQSDGATGCASKMVEGHRLGVVIRQVNICALLLGKAWLGSLAGRGL